MAKYLIGDVQGCFDTLQLLLSEIEFSPSRDYLYFLGDVVNRGGGCLAVLRFLYANAHAVTNVMGNHDLHLLAVAQGVRAPLRGDTLDAILAAPDKVQLLDWLAIQPFSIYLNVHNLLLVHAGVLPSWTLENVLRLSKEVESVMAHSDSRAQFLAQMYGNQPNSWDETLTGIDRIRTITNALTRLRFCTQEGVMNFHDKGAVASANTSYVPWFDVKKRQTKNTAIAFGHWSTLGGLYRPDLCCLDTGCVWGGPLTALRLDEKIDGAEHGQSQHERIQVSSKNGRPLMK